MRAMVIQPGVAGSASVAELEGPVGEGDVLVERPAVGICGTNVEVAAGKHGTSPPGAEFLVLGNESVGRVVAPPGQWRGRRRPRGRDRRVVTDSSSNVEAVDVLADAVSRRWIGDPALRHLPYAGAALDTGTVTLDI